MGTPVFKLIYDRRHRATATKEGAIELRITYDRIQRFATTGVRVLPKQWKNGFIVNRPDALELQQALDMFVTKARRIINEQMQAGTLDMQTIVAVIGGKEKEQSTANVPKQKLLVDYFRERATIRKYGRTDDSQARYDRFIAWFERWGGMPTFADITEVNILKMDEMLVKRGLKPYSIWNNYHRFLNSFIIDAMNEGLLRKNPYKGIHINRDPTADALNKYLTVEEFERIRDMSLPSEYLRHARDLFVFQTYTGLSYIDLEAFDATMIREVKGKPVYAGRRGKTNQEFTFLLIKPAMEILKRYNMQLPMLSNQKYNNYIKMVAVMAGINKPVSSHWARHTCATMLLNNGVGMEVVSKVLGHSSTKITREVYAKLLDETVADAMSLVENKITSFY
ncbi:MAG: tyrosine-type recombinase/integrase [Bacteroidales bacterium]|nr:tyrosine-type recombinase/integrase [Bacteroidales bacterium]